MESGIFESKACGVRFLVCWGGRYLCRATFTEEYTAQVEGRATTAAKVVVGVIATKDLAHGTALLRFRAHDARHVPRPGNNSNRYTR